MLWLELTIASANLLLVGVTALSFIPSNESWIRVWDFPRQQIATLLALVLLATFLLLDPRSVAGLATIALSLIALGCQTYRIWPYTLLHAVQVERAQTCSDNSRLSLLIANVLVTNRSSAPLVRLVREMQPDLVLLVETGPWWAKELGALHADYPHVISHPSKRYGMYLLSRLELADPQVRFLVDERFPSIRTGVKLPSGATFTLYGLHPAPPPLHDTARRDAELVVVARETKNQERPVIVAGLERRCLVAHDPAVSGNQRAARPAHRSRLLFHVQREPVVAAMAARSRVLRPVIHAPRLAGARRHRVRPFPPPYHAVSQACGREPPGRALSGIGRSSDCARSNRGGQRKSAEGLTPALFGCAPEPGTSRPSLALVYHSNGHERGEAPWKPKPDKQNRNKPKPSKRCPEAISVAKRTT
jgi:endonuclease/exonuclease/phosphatase (EEP) superfamily protein YafD